MKEKYSESSRSNEMAGWPTCLSTYLPTIRLARYVAKAISKLVAGECTTSAAETT